MRNYDQWLERPYEDDDVPEASEPDWDSIREDREDLARERAERYEE